MISSFFIISLLFVMVTSQDDESLFFKSNQTMLSKCVENYLLNDRKYAQGGIAKEISVLAAKRFSGKIISMKILNERIHYFTYSLRHKKVYARMNSHQLSRKFGKIIKGALEYCSGKSGVSKLVSDSEQEIVDATAPHESNEWFSFGRDKKMLAECINDQLFFINRLYKKSHYIEKLANLTARRFYGKTILKRAFTQKVSMFFHFLSNKKNSQKLSEPLKKAMKQALKKCVLTSRKTRAVPVYVSESPELSTIMNYMLVSWSNDLQNMIESRDGRALLRRYARDAQTALVRALNSFQDFDIFRNFLRVLWMCRIREFFNELSINDLFLTYHYVSNNSSDYAEGRINFIFTEKGEQNLISRNRSASQVQTNRILNIHNVHQYFSSSPEDISDIFDDYSINGMTSAEYYLESHIIDFYRILFFFFELRVRGINTDEDDDYAGPLPYDVISEQLQAIVYDDDSYRDYLLHERSFYDLLADMTTKNAILHHLVEAARVFEEDLIMLKLNAPSTSGILSSSTISSTESTTTEKSMSSTTENHPFKRKGEVWMNEYGKFFSKRIKSGRSSDCSSSTDSKNFETKNLKQLSELCVQKHYNHFAMNSSKEEHYFGYILPGDHKPNQLISEKLFIFKQLKKRLVLEIPSIK